MLILYLKIVLFTSKGDLLLQIKGEKMTEDKVQLFLATNAKFFPAEKMVLIKEKLSSSEDSKLTLLTTIEYKDPTTLLLFSIFLGSFGVDRFMLGDTGMGILKLLTGGLCGILTIIDWFSITKKTKELNFTNLMMVI